MVGVDGPVIQLSSSRVACRVARLRIEQRATSDGVPILWDGNRATIPAYIQLFDECCEENSLFIEYCEYDAVSYKQFLAVADPTTVIFAKAPHLNAYSLYNPSLPRSSGSR